MEANEMGVEPTVERGMGKPSRPPTQGIRAFGATKMIFNFNTRSPMRNLAKFRENRVLEMQKNRY
jgi:hypothetical protein